MLAATVDISEAIDALDGMKRQGDRLGPAFRELRKPMRADQREHAKKQEGPEGRWQPRAPITGASARAKRRRRRKLLGRLPGAITVRATATSVIAESKVAWSGVHQEGGKVGRGARIPARPFLWLSDAMIEKAIAVFEEHLLEGWGAR